MSNLGEPDYKYYSLKDIPELPDATSAPSLNLPPFEFPYANATDNSTYLLTPFTNTNSSSNSNETSFYSTNETNSIPPTDTEVIDMLNINLPSYNPEDLKPNAPHQIYNDVDQPDRTVLVDEEENTEDVLRDPGKLTERNHGVALVQGQMAAILAGVFVAVAVIGYIALMTWRRYLENRYSGREMLVNEFEYNAKDENLKYFSI